MVGGQADVKLVSNAMANATRRKIMAMLVESNRSREEIEKAIGASMLDYHLQLMQQAGLIEQKDGAVLLTEFGKNFMQSKAEKPAEAKKDLAGTKPIEIAEVKQLLPCIADASKFRIIAKVSPPLGGALKILEPLFPRARYSEKIGALIIQKGNILITIYSTGNVTMTMIGSEVQARETLDDLKKTINEAIIRGVTPVPREKVILFVGRRPCALPLPVPDTAAVSVGPGLVDGLGAGEAGASPPEIAGTVAFPDRASDTK